MKTLKDFTPEIQAKIPEYIKKYTNSIENGERYKDFILENATNLVNWNYEICGYKKPVIIVAENPYEAQIFFNFIKLNKEKYLPILYLIYCLKNNLIKNCDLSSELDSTLRSELSSKLSSELDSELDSKLDSTLYSELRSKLDSTLLSELRSKLDSTLLSKLDSTLYSELRSKLDSGLRSKLDSGLLSKLRSKLLSALDSELSSTLFSKLLSELRSGLHSELDSELDSALLSKLDSTLYLELRSKLDSTLLSELRSKLDSELDSELYSALLSKLDSELYLELRSKLDSTLYSELLSALDSGLSSTLFSKLRSKLRSKLLSELDSGLLSELRSKLLSELDSGLLSELRSTLLSKLRSGLHSELDSELDSGLHSELDSTLFSGLDSTLFSGLRSALDSELLSELGSGLSSTLFSGLRSGLDSGLDQYNVDYLFTTNIYSNILLAWWKFIKDEFNINCGEIGIKLDSWNDMYLKSNIYSAIFSEILCIVSKYPKKIYRDENNNLHNVNEMAVKWGFSLKETQFNCYYVHGREVPKFIFNKINNNTLTKNDFINEENEDIKASIYEIIESKGEGSILKFLDVIEVDKQNINHVNGCEEMILYKTKELFKEEVDLNGKSPAPLAWLKMTCPSTGSVYLIPTDGSFNNVIDAAKYHRPSEVPIELDYFWNSRN